MESCKICQLNGNGIRIKRANKNAISGKVFYIV